MVLLIKVINAGKNGLRGNHWIRLLPLAIVFLVLFSMPEVSYAEEEELYFQSDRQREITEENITLLHGNVEVHFRTYIIWANDVRVDDDKKEIFATGDIKMTGEDRIVYGDALWYNYDTEQFLMTNVSGEILVADVSEPVHFTAKELRGTPKVFKMVDGTATTCTPDEPQEVHIRARMIKVLEDNKIIFRNGYFFVYDVPILFFPYWVFSLKEVPYEIRVGKNSSDGWYVEVDWHYLYKENVYGTIIGNYYEKRGWEFGADHQWNIPSQGTGKAFFTYLKDKQSGPQTVIRLSQNFTPSKNTKISLSLDQSSRSYYTSEDQQSNDRLNSRISFSRNTFHSNISMNLSLNSIKANTDSTNFQSDVTYRHNWKKAKLSFNTKFAYSSSHASGAPADQRLKTTYDLTKSGSKKVDWKILFDFVSDPDGDKKLNDGTNVLERAPEITMTVMPEVFNVSRHNPLQIEMKPLRLLGGHYFDLRPSGEIHGLFGSLDTEFSKNMKFSQGTDLNLSIGYNQAIASNGNAKYKYNPSIRLTNKFSKKVNMNTSWSQSVDKGHNPFPTFDRSGSTNSITWTLNYRQGKKWDLRWNTNYNVKADTWGNLNWTIRWTPNDLWKANMTVNYRIELKEFGDLNPSFTYNNKKNFRNETQLNWSVKNQELTRFRNATDYRIGDEWMFSLILEPDVMEGLFNDIFQDVLITKLNPCTFYQLSYRATREEFFFTWGVTAFPAAKISVGEGIESFGSFDQFASSGNSFG